jgi:L-threonylcarbamoyladenylate synthase
MTAPVPSPEEILAAAEALQRGELAAFPTETVYGLGADAFNETAVAKIFEAKRRPRFDPLIVHVSCAAEAFALWARVPETARLLAEKFWPGPLTLVLEKIPAVPDIVTAGLPTLAVRVPAHPAALALLRAFGGPVAAPSANPFGRLSPTSASDVRRELGGRVSVILDAGPAPMGIESTVLSLVEKPVLLRPGALPVEDIEALTGPVERAAKDSRPRAPGMLERHYAPAAPLYLWNENMRGGAETDVLNPETAALLCLDEAPAALKKISFQKTFRLSPEKNLREAACRFFSTLREMEGAGAIVAALFPEEGLGLALNDRLRRGASGEAALRQDGRLGIRPRV